MEVDAAEPISHTLQARFVSDTGEEAGPPLDLPINVTKEQLGLICNALLKNVSFRFCSGTKNPDNTAIPPGE